MAFDSRLAAGNAGLLVTVFFWGSMVPLTALLLPVYDAHLLAALRYGIAAPTLLLLLALGRGGLLPLEISAARLLMLGAAMASFATFYNLGLVYSDPVTIAIILTSGPVLASIMARVMYGTAFEPGMGLALVLAVCGGLLVVWGGAPGGELAFRFRGGEGLVIFAQLCWIWYTFKAQEWRGAMSTLKMTAISSTCATLWLVAVHLLFALIGFSALITGWPTVEHGAMLLWLGVGAGGIAVVFWNIGATSLGVPVSALYLNLIPVVAVLISVAFGAQASVLQLAGGALVLTGVLQVQVRRLRRARAPG
jgi:drug/metabolite transporter (DMT)-like permease